MVKHATCHAMQLATGPAMLVDNVFMKMRVVHVSFLICFILLYFVRIVISTHKL